MKKRVLSLLLSALMVLAVTAPMASVATAAKTPVLRVNYYVDETPNYILINDMSTLTYGNKFTVSVITSNKTVFAYLDGLVTDTFGYYFDMPSSDWTLFVCVNGHNEVMSRYNEPTKSFMGFGTNGDMMVYPLNSGSTLKVTGDYDSAKWGALAADYYGFYANGMFFGPLGESKDMLNLDIEFELKLKAHTPKEVYPFKVKAKNANCTLKNVNLTGNINSDYTHVNPENTPVILDGNTYLNISAKTDVCPSKDTHTFHYLKYASTFHGIVHVETKNGYYCGGPYGGEGPVDPKAGLSDIFRQRYRTVIGDTEYYHAIAKNCGFSQFKAGRDAPKSAFAFPLSYGYTLPDRIIAGDFVASVKWNDVDTNADVTGKTVEYGKRYKATFTVVPRYYNYFDWYDLSYYLPARAYYINTEDDGAFVKKLVIAYNKLVRPDTVITLQPTDYSGSGTDKRAVFTVNTNDSEAAYQWQMSNSATGPWTDVKDITVMSSTPVTGAKNKNLIYDFGYSSSTVDLRADLKYFRCKITGTAEGAETVLYTNVVKYEYIKTKVSKIVINGLDAPDGKSALDTTATTQTSVVSVAEVFYTKNGAKVTSVSPGDTVHIVVEVKVNSAYTIDPKTTVAEWNGMTCLKSYLGGTQYFLLNGDKYRCEFEYTVPRVITDITITNVRVPFNGAGFITDLPTLTATSGSNCIVGFKRGWYDGIKGATSSPQVGETYYMYLALQANEGYKFTRDPSAFSFKFTDLAGAEVIPADVYIDNYRTISGKDVVEVYIGFECTEVRIRKGTSILDLDSPVAGKKLDTDISILSGQVELSFIEYAVNGQYITDPDTQFPAAGDTVDIYVGVKSYNESWAYDDEIYAYWYMDTDNTDNPPVAITRRDWSYPVGPEICVFRFTWQVPKASGNVITEIGFCHLVQPATGQKTNNRVTALHPDQIDLVDFAEWKLYDQYYDSLEDLSTNTSFTAGNDYVVRLKYQVRPGFTVSGSAKYVIYDHYGGELDYYAVRESRLGNTVYADFYITAAAKHPALPETAETQITMLNVTRPAIGEYADAGSIELAEPIKFVYHFGMPTFRRVEGDNLIAMDASEIFAPGKEYVLDFFLRGNNQYVFGDESEMSLLLLDADGDQIAPTKVTYQASLGNKGMIVRAYFKMPDTSDKMYSVKVSGGHASKTDAYAGEKITVMADPAPAGQVFDRWTCTQDVVLSDIYSPTATFIMPGRSVLLKANYKDQNASGVMLGDVDDDTKITASDARLCLRRAVDLETYAPGTRAFIACDVDKDGSVTANDARSILRAAVELEDPATW